LDERRRFAGIERFALIADRMINATEKQQFSRSRVVTIDTCMEGAVD